jgi:large subunit ribosomal protein L16
VRGRHSYIAKKNNKFTSGIFGLKAMSIGKINTKQLESMSKHLTKRIKKKIGYVYNKITLNKTLTKKPTGIRMGKGKGEIKDIINYINRGKYLFEINLFKKKAYDIIGLINACKRSPIQTEIIYNYKVQTNRINKYIQFT